MNKKIFISLIAVFTVFAVIPDAHSLSIEGWWRANMTIEEGDFVTGAWFTTQAKVKKVSYLYISDSHENTFQGTAQLILWNPGTGQYNAPETYTVYQRNNIIVFTLVGSFDDDGNARAGSTLVLIAFGTVNATALKGYYTLFDIENTTTPEQFVRMGPVNASRVDVSQVPADVTALIP